MDNICSNIYIKEFKGTYIYMLYILILVLMLIELLIDIYVLTTNLSNHSVGNLRIQVRTLINLYCII